MATEPRPKASTVHGKSRYICPTATGGYTIYTELQVKKYYFDRTINRTPLEVYLVIPVDLWNKRNNYRRRPVRNGA